MSHVVIIGAGPAGLALAFRLKQLRTGLRLTILEARNRPGGNVGTLSLDGFRVEIGPNGFLDNKPGMMALCRDLDLADRLIPASEGSRKNRFVFLGGRLVKLPGSPLELLTTPLLTPAGKFALLTEPLRARPRRLPPDESVTEFARRRLGREAADIFIDALVTGIHAGDPRRLSVTATFPRLVQFECEHGSVLRGFLAAMGDKKREALARGEPPAPQRMWSFREGMQVLIDALAELAGPVTIGAAARRVERSDSGWVVRGDGVDRWEADAVVLACPAHVQSDILAGLDPELAGELAAIPYNRVVVAAMGYRAEDVPGPPEGFGYIAPQNTRRDVLGVQWCSSIFPDRAPPGFVLWRVLCGGVNRPDVFDWPDAELLRACHREMLLAMGVRGEPAFTHVVRWPRAIPQYEVGHLARVKRISALTARHPDLHLAGNAFPGVALNDVAEHAEQLAYRIAASFPATHRD